MQFNQNSTQIGATIAELEEKIEMLKNEQNTARRREKQYQLLAGHDGATRYKSGKMPDSELADKCRGTALFQFFSLLGDKVGFQVALPIELANKSIAQVLYILDYIDDDATLDSIEIEGVAE